LVGIGNCASALVQGLEYYRDHPEDSNGLITHRIGPYAVGDIHIVAAFDVDTAKVGLDVSKAIHAGKNNARRLYDVPPLGTVVSAGPVLDGLGGRYREHVSSPAEGTRDEVLQTLRKSGAVIIINYLPVGSREATRWWADVAIEAGCAFVNCIPEFLASDPDISRRFTEASLPLLGDDVKSQFGATLLHRIIVEHLERKGHVIDNMYQLNFGGNMDFYNMLDHERLASKRLSKREAVRSLQKMPLDPGHVHIGPSDHVAWLQDDKWCYIHIQGRGFAGAPMRLEAKLEVCDSPNSAGVVTDVIRLARIALDRGIGGPVREVCAFYMKSPPVPMTDDAAWQERDSWLAEDTQ
jgi:myo-inositol-1-phosphate synthase